MPFVKCSVGSCSRKLQPVLKVDPRDRDTWFYRECEVCLRPACEEHSSGVEGRGVCDRCRRGGGGAGPPPPAAGGGRSRGGGGGRRPPGGGGGGGPGMGPPRLPPGSQ